MRFSKNLILKICTWNLQLISFIIFCSSFRMTLISFFLHSKIIIFGDPMKNRPRMALRKGKWTAIEAKNYYWTKNPAHVWIIKIWSIIFCTIKLLNLLLQCVNLHSFQYSLKSIKELSEIIFLFIKSCKLCSYLKWAGILLFFCDFAAFRADL